jgi:hypothetical protein
MKKPATSGFKLQAYDQSGVTAEETPFPLRFIV